MNVQHDSGWLAVTLLAALIALAIGIPSTASAVTITGSTYASESAGVPTPNPASTSFNLSNPITISDSIRSDVLYSHAQASALATVTPTGVTKSTSGRAWVDTTAASPPNGFPRDARGDLWNATASGTHLIVNGPSGTAQFQFKIPGNTLLTASQNPDPGRGSSFGNPDPIQMFPTTTGQQGFVINRGGMGSAMPSFFDIFVDVDAVIVQNGNSTTVFQGTLQVNPGNLSVVGQNGFAGVSPHITPGSTSQPEASITLDDIFSSVDPTVQVGVPFDAFINVRMSMGDPSFQFNGGDAASSIPPTNFPGGSPPAFTGFPTDVGPIGAGGAFAAELNLVDQADYSLALAPVPEPESLVLFGLGGILLLFVARRRLVAWRAGC